MLQRLLGASAFFGALTFLAAGSAPARTAVTDGPAGRFDLDGSHTEVMFNVKHLGISNFYGRFDKVTGKVIVDADDPAESMIHLDIDAKSIDTNDAARDKHLRSADFFNVEEHASIVFDSETITAKDATHFEVAGTLEMHGAKKPVMAQVEQTGYGTVGQFGTRVGYEAKLTIKRSEFGMDYMPGGLGEEVEILISLEGVKK